MVSAAYSNVQYIPRQVSLRVCRLSLLQSSDLCCVCVCFTDCPGVTAGTVWNLLTDLTLLTGVVIGRGVDGAVTEAALDGLRGCSQLEILDLQSSSLSSVRLVESLKGLAQNAASSPQHVILPAGVTEEQLEALLEPLVALKKLSVSAPRAGGSRWLQALPQTLVELDITGEMLPHWEHVMSVTSVQSGSRGVRCVRCICVPVTDGDTTRAWLQQTV